VIIASRLSGEAKAGQILLTQRLHAAVEQHVDAEAIGELSLKGQTRPTAAFSVMSLR
jgi:class 3 adenylate cyclase